MESTLDLPNLADFFVATIRHFTNAIFLGVFPPAVFAMITWFLLRFVQVQDQEVGNDENRDARLRVMSPEERTFGAAFAALGTLIGVFLGASRVGVVGAILPAIITMASGYLAYLFSKDTNIVNRHIIPVCILSIVLCASGGAFYGSSIRAINEQNDRLWEKHLIEFKEIEVPLNKKVLEKKLENDSSN